jgi:hypothetical protein
VRTGGFDVDEMDGEREKMEETEGEREKNVFKLLRLPREDGETECDFDSVDVDDETEVEFLSIGVVSFGDSDCFMKSANGNSDRGDFSLLDCVVGGGGED